MATPLGTKETDKQVVVSPELAIEHKKIKGKDHIIKTTKTPDSKIDEDLAHAELLQQAFSGDKIHPRHGNVRVKLSMDQSELSNQQALAGEAETPGSTLQNVAKGDFSNNWIKALTEYRNSKSFKARGDYGLGVSLEDLIRKQIG